MQGMRAAAQTHTPRTPPPNLQAKFNHGDPKNRLQGFEQEGDPAAPDPPGGLLGRR